MYWFFLNFRKLSPNILYVHFQVNFSLSSGLFEKLSEAGSGGGGAAFTQKVHLRFSRNT